MSGFRYDRNLQVGEVGFNAMKQDELTRLIANIPVEKRSAYVVFCGVPGVVLADSDPKIAQSLNEATLCAMDGMPIANIAKKQGIDSERCGGPDIMLKVIEQGLSSGKRHYFYGSTPETLRKLDQNLREKFPGIQIAGKFSPPFRDLTPEEDREVIKLINETKPDFIWVGLGAPKQDFWMQAHRDSLNHCILMGVGAAFDFHSEKIKRAPLWMQEHSLEWLYRLIREPGRLWKRYLVQAPQFVAIRAKDRKKAKKRQKLLKKQENQEK
ncbi:MAG: WecB/TagA/CpsF family glycosyltransferase [Clostridia bacterium]|nr:WecB/TagA/CpsF family glycosyltransferase [Clostridia bacterium]